MANASAKRTAAQNETALRNLKIWMLAAPFIALFIRFFFRSSLFPSRTSIFIHVLTFIPLFVLYTHLNSIGSPRRDPTTGALIGSGEDLNMSGVTEWCWDIIYVTWGCQIGSAALGEWFWWVYLCIPLFALYKIYSVFLKPYFFSKAPESASTEDETAQSMSKRQQKLKKRSDKGDPRVKRL
ncbi:hypothetical protein M408DRAFT_326137 [Serendipita vermifera MAFF 305830]|uniref:DUF788-domain-containing protein n=1 Tax=Serendipita vermifera MAFF 305830 TaxID=933852 RepID=A0A0C3BMT4_SERVB|nr:hypothetical protein M408DRAFT_326137 [Serendipita vermifera MAFF 305830]